MSASQQINSQILAAFALWCLVFKNGQSHLKNLAALAAKKVLSVFNHFGTCIEVLT